jgi:hypothetical protein
MTELSSCGSPQLAADDKVLLETESLETGYIFVYTLAAENTSTKMTRCALASASRGAGGALAGSSGLGAAQ